MQKVSIYKFKSSVPDSEILVEKAPDPIGNLSTEVSEHEFSGKVFFDILKSKKEAENIPWIAILDDANDSDKKIEFSSFNQFPRGAILLKITVDGEDHVYAICFGMHAHSWFNSDSLVPDFGVICAMNMCDPERLKRIQSTRHEGITAQSEIQMSVASQLDIFGINESTEFIKAISATAREEFDFAETIQGRESIVVKTDKKLGVADIIDMCAELSKVYISDIYKSAFPMYEKFRFVVDRPLIDKLNEIVAKKIYDKEYSNIHLAVPEFFEFDRYMLSYSGSEDAELYGDLDVSHLNIGKNLKRGEKFSAKTLKTKAVFKRDLETGAIFSAYKLFNCIVAEISYGGSLFVLSEGRWKQASTEFVDEIAEYLEGIEIESGELINEKILIWDADKQENREAVFNEAIDAKSEEFILLDRKKFEIAGRRAYEMCDLLGQERQMLHVKRWGSGSASISQVFIQGRFYADALVADKKFRLDIRKGIAKIEGAERFLELIPIERADLNDNDFKVIFFLIGEGISGKKLSDLPFMSQYELVYTCRHLSDDRNFKTAVAFCDVDFGPPPN